MEEQNSNITPHEEKKKKTLKPGTVIWAKISCLTKSIYSKKGPNMISLLNGHSIKLHLMFFFRLIHYECTSQFSSRNFYN